MQNNFRWIYLAHLGYNMWLEPLMDSKGIRGTDVGQTWSTYVNATDTLRFQEGSWDTVTARLKESGCNTILLDIGEGLQFESHPELAIKGSWTKEKLDRELSRLRGLGFEVLPKLNFSAGHDQWLGEYSRMLSTSLYYRVTRDLIAETAELFGNPALFHLGMDEETPQHQENYNYIVVRQGEQWWYDFRRLLAAVEDAGCRPWIWADYGWFHKEQFLNLMPREVVQSNWYYGDFSQEDYDAAPYISWYEELEKAGYDQIPTGSNWAVADNFSKTVEFGNKTFSRDFLMGYMQTVWHPTMKETLPKHNGAIADLEKGISLYQP